MWLRGVTPQDWTYREPIHVEEFRWINGIDPTLSLDPEKDTYLDGSGEVDSADPRICAVGWTWTQLIEGT